MSNGTATSARVTISGTGIDALYDTRAEPDAAATSSSASIAASSGPTGLVSPSLRELGVNGVWSVSSAKLGNGVDQLRDDDIATFWQSDGTLPHTITCQFHKKTRVECIAIYADQKMDESYAPSRISIRVGSGAAGAPEAAAAAAETGDAPGNSDSSLDWREIDRFELVEPQGWIICHLRENGQNDDATFGGAEQQDSIRCHFVQVVILGSFQNGRDVHIRQCKVFGPRNVLDDLATLSSVECRQYAQLR